MKRLSDAFVRSFERRTLSMLLLLALLAGGLTGVGIAFALDRSELALMVAQVSDYQASVLSRVYADDETTVIGEFFLERRIPIDYEKIPQRVINAFIAIEDARFYQHYGLDPVGIMAAFWDNVREGRIVRGGSTITQQLALGLFLTRELTFWRKFGRKFKEALLALLIERYYTKEQILELYCNQIYLGGNAYGVEAAAQYYFGKSAKDLTLAESAMLAALPKSPVNYSPIHYPDEARHRRSLVLNAMVDQRFITPAEAEAAKSEPIEISRAERISNIHSPYAYLVEVIRQDLESKYGTRKTHTGGLQVYTTLDAKAQQDAVRAVRAGIHAYDRRHGWRRRVENILDAGESLDSFYHPDWDSGFEVGKYYAGLVMKVSDQEARVRFGSYVAEVTKADAPWGRPLRDLVRPGDLTIFRVNEVSEESRTLKVALLQYPSVQGALVALEIPSGEVKSLVGGYDFNASRFNRAIQSHRQTGSAFKPFIYAAAVEYGLRPEDPVLDEPFRLGDWEPHNYDSKYLGLIDVATAVAQSRNIPAVRVLQEIEIYRAVRMVERLGLPNPMAPYLPSALGATEEPLIDMVKAYAVFANRGRRVYPHYIRRVVDRNGTELERWSAPEPEEVLSPYVASTVVRLMQGVVERGTAGSIRGHSEFAKWGIGGKTGTVNNFTDAWFLGYTPTVCTGVWIGFDEKKSLGDRESGSVAALPIWIDFMKGYLKDLPPKQFDLVASPTKELVELQEKRRSDRGALILGSRGQPLPLIGGPPNLDAIADVPGPQPRSGGGIVPLTSPEALMPKSIVTEPPPENRQKRPHQ